MREHQKHIEAFEMLMGLGGGATNSNFSKIADRFHISERTAWNWYRELNWKTRIELRNIENAKKLEKKTNKIIVDRKANLLKVADALLAKFVGNLKADKIDITGVADYERIGRMTLLLLGEGMGEGDQTPILIINMPESEKDNGGNSKNAIEAPRYKVQEKEGDLNELT